MYLFYIDESGNRDIGHIEQERFYVLTAVGMFEGHWKRFYFDLAYPKNRIISRIEESYGISLDFATDAALRKAIATRLAGITLIIVSQRVGSLMNADSILVLDDGRQVGLGKHAQLLESCDIYREIYESQTK